MPRPRPSRSHPHHRPHYRRGVLLPYQEIISDCSVPYVRDELTGECKLPPLLKSLIKSGLAGLGRQRPGYLK